ncbi:MAG: TonB family protein, partial [Gallionellaceae bacterium]|nr:TonB family protein [Gallionellaceae bacterium]
QHVTQVAPLIPAPVQTPALQPLQGKPAEQPQSAQTLPPAEHNSPAPSRADASKPAASGQTSSDRPTHLDNEKSGVALNKPANVDTSSFPGLDIKAPEKPAENNGPKLHLGVREKTISLKEQDLTYQLYAESVRMKLERLGRLNYPIEAARNNISGTLVVLISIRADGGLENFKILQPSYDVLNDAASRIVQLSSPFSVFPPKLKEDLDVLNIQITWTFESSQQLFQ